MKLFIWLGCIIIMSGIHVVLMMTIGITSPILETAVAMAMARHFCKKWDKRSSTNKKNKPDFNMAFESQDVPVYCDFEEENVCSKGNNIKETEEIESLPITNSIEGNLVEKQTVTDSSNPFEILKQLNDLHSEGVLTDEEYSEKKKEILNRI